MKIMNIGKFLLLGLVFLAIMNSCASTGFLMAKAEVTMYASPYPAKTRNSQIDIYRTNKPTKDYLEIAEISCGDTNDNWNMQQIMLKAREIGADGIIIIGKSGTEAVGVPIGKNVYAASSEYGLKAIAIKYK